MSKAQWVGIASRLPDRRSRGFRAIAATIVLVLMTWVVVASVAPSAHADAGCNAAANPVVCENALAGTDPDVWDIQGAGDQSIQGFSTDISVNIGGTIGFKIDTDARAYSIDIYRTGYYQGDGARKIASVSPSVTLPQTQPECVTDDTTELTDCGNWAQSASWTVPPNAVSGVYFALLTRSDTGGQSHIVFIVRNDASHSAVLFQTSDPTWQAYNTYGGADFYQGGANGRAYKISYNRPIVTRGDNSGRDFYFSNEYPTVRFLEKNGYDVSYFSGVDTDRHGSELKNHKVFLSVGHDEYWSAAQRSNVTAARDAGVNLQFLSGNEVYWHTRYENSVAGTPTAYRTLVSYKETWANTKIDPTSEWTGTWRDPRFASQANGAGIPENQLTGTMYMSNFSDLPITVTQAQGKTRMWRNTSLTSMTGASTALAQHTIGYESDEDIDNGFRPAGMVDLSTTVGAVPQYLTDFGNTVVPGTTTHHITLYRAASGALVFSAGTIQWAWGLDQTHDGDGAAADPRMQQAQVNLLADMGAQPATLASGLVAATASTDKTPPAVTITTPTAGATIANGASVTISGSASDVGGVVAGVEVSTDGGSTWHPATGTTSWSYAYVQHGLGSVDLKVRASDDSANTSSPVTRTVTVGGPATFFGTATPATADAGDASAVELGLRFTPTQSGFITGVRFYKSAANTGTHTGSLWDAAGTRLATVTFTGESGSGWQTANFVSPVAVTAGTAYTISYSAPSGHYAATVYQWPYANQTNAPFTVAGGYGAAPGGVYNTTIGQYPASTFQATNYWVDPVFATTDTSPLTATGQWPLPGSSSVAASTTIGAVLSKPVTSSTIAFTVKDQLGATVAGSVAYDSTTRIATFTPSAALSGFVTYSVAVTAKDTNGIALSGGGTWSFVTAKPDTAPGTCPCGVFTDTTTPSVLQVADSPVTLGMKFSSSVAGQVTGVRFYKNSANTGTHVGTLWAADGTKLAQATFTNESTAGWQTVTFSTPVNITPNTNYFVSYRTPTGYYSVTPSGLQSAITRGPLSAAAAGGAYNYSDGFPGAASTTNYLVDVVFTKAPDPISVSSATPANGAIDVDPASTIAVTLSSPLASGYSLTAKAGSTAIAGSTALSSDGTTLTFTPGQALPAGAVVTVTLSGVVSTGGATLATQTWSFTVKAATPTAFTLLGNSTPATVDATDDSSSVELGMAFTPSQAGTVTAIRFFKGSGNTGTHTGSIWSTSGTRLATVTFTGETANGWQTAQLSTPLALNAGQTYVVSYLAPHGNYSYTTNGFANPVTNGPLTAVSGNNGRYLYGSGGFPTYSINSTDYFVDVVFSPSGTTTTGGGGGGSTPASTTIFPSTSAPANPAWPDGTPVQLGVRFSSAAPGTVTAIRFYKGAGDTGTHTVYLWSGAGVQLATATSTAESASGWQEVPLSTPVAITAGTEYRASYYTTGTTYAVDPSGLSSAVTNAPLSTYAGGGVYGYSTAFPNNTVSHNYWVDVHFVATQ